MLYLLSHHEGEVTLEHWRWALEEWSQFPNLVVASTQLAAKTIRESGLWTDSGGDVWSRSFDAENNYNLLASSPAINAGIPIVGYHDQVTPATDAAGVAVLRGPDIGAYQYAADYNRMVECCSLL